MKKYFALIFVLLMLLSGCSHEKTEIDLSKSFGEKTESEIVIPASDPIIYSADDILEDDTSETVRDYYYSMDPFEYIRVIFSKNPDAENSSDGYIGDDVITYLDDNMEVLRIPVYAMGELPKVFDVSLARVQWLDSETAMIDGRFVFNKETLEKEEFNPNWGNMLNYALNKNKDKLAVSFLDSVDAKSVYRLALYDFTTGEWETLFEDENEKIYYFYAKLIWRNNNEIIFSAGIKREESGTLSDEEYDPVALDIYSFNLERHKCTLLMEGAEPMCNTGSFVKDRILCSKYIADEHGSMQREIWVYDFAKESASRIYESGFEEIFWLPQKGIFGFYAKEEKCIKLYCDSTYALLGKVDLSSVVLNEDDGVSVDAGADYIRFSVYEREKESTKRYKVNISDIRERNYFFMDYCYLGYTERGEFYNRTHSENVYGEFLSQEGYDVYSQDGYISRSTEVEFDIVPGLDNFFEEKYAELLGELASVVSEDQQTGVFKLPVSMSEEAFNVPHYDYNGYIDFVGVGNVLTNKEVRLVTNAKHNILSRKVGKTTVKESDLEIIKKELEKDGITKAPVNVTEVLVCDLDGDGADERVIFANSSDDEFVGDENSGNYTMVLVKSENAVELLNKETSRYGEAVPDLGTWENWVDHIVGYAGCAGIYDLNGDGKFEICVELGQYGHGRYMVFSENEDGKYSLVLNSEFGT